MSPNVPASFQCAECGAILRELRDAWRSDHESVRSRFQEAAESSARNPEEFRNEWVWSLARMPDEELRTLMDAHYPQAAEARRKRMEHESLTGHSIVVNGWHGFQKIRGDSQ